MRWCEKAASEDAGFPRKRSRKATAAFDGVRKVPYVEGRWYLFSAWRAELERSRIGSAIENGELREDAAVCLSNASCSLRVASQIPIRIGRLKRTVCPPAQANPLDRLVAREVSQ